MIRSSMSEIARLRSFVGWTIEQPSPGKLARAGFYRTGERDAVRCAWCMIEVYDWKPNDDPMIDHARWLRSQRRDARCVFVDGNETRCCAYIASNETPCHPAFADAYDRLLSYDEQSVVTRSLAEAGFVCIANRILCFHCGEEMPESDRLLEPWTVHARIQPECRYLIRGKGRNFAVFAQWSETPTVSSIRCANCGGRVDAVSWPCGHMATCSVCAFDASCLVCRETIESATRVFFDDSGERFVDENARRRTFADWPHGKPTPEILARVGFYFTGDRDVVRCFSCKIELWNWDNDMDPRDRHARWSPYCNFLRKSDESDTLSPQNSAVVDQRRSADVCGITNAYRRVRYPEYEDAGDREATYDARWKRPQIARDMAASGFFYVGAPDKVLCYYCGCGLKDWKDTDDPWEEHAKWRPSCQHLNAIKGREYVRAVSQQSFFPMLERPPLCKICCVGVVDSVFLPCGHAMACGECSAKTQKCYVCRGKATNTMPVSIV